MSALCSNGRKSIAQTFQQSYEASSVRPMEANPWQQPLVTASWPDEQAGPFSVQVHLACAERWEYVAIALAFLARAQARPLKSSERRSWRRPPIVERAHGKLGQASGGEPDRAVAALPGPDEFDALKRHLRAEQVEQTRQVGAARKAGRPPLPREELKRVAELYGNVFYDHEPPTQALADFLGCGKATAAKRVALGRQRGILICGGCGVAAGRPVALRRGRSRASQVLLAFQEAGAQFRPSERPPRRKAAINNRAMTMAKGPLQRSLERLSADQMPPQSGNLAAIRVRRASLGAPKGRYASANCARSAPCARQRACKGTVLRAANVIDFLQYIAV